MKKAVIVIVVIAVLGAIGAAVVLKDDDNKGTNTSTQNQTQSQNTNTDSTETESQAPVSATDEVEIENFAFSPSSITIKKGTKVTWTNKDSTSHTVTPDQPGGGFTGSDLLAKDETYSFTFTEVGEYKYHCQPHPQMTGSVTVTE